MSAATRDALEAALAVPVTGVAQAQRRQRVIEAAARAHLASERSEAVEALERVKAKTIAALKAAGRHGDVAPSLTCLRLIDHEIAELSRLREGT